MPARAGAFFVFAAPELSYDRHDPEQQKRLISDAFSGLGREVPRLLLALHQAPDLYFDPISRVDVATWSTGRVCLVGDAACGATIGGMGTGSAVVAAYVLAGESRGGIGRGLETVTSGRDGTRPGPVTAICAVPAPAGA
nr:hypothetical protein StreXyl84_01560 [Streptomyces sp. Xyl84]